jgi:cytochrome c oxidase cbb3-type subunit 4
MSTYETLRMFSASWGLAYFVLIFVVAVVFALLPSRKRAYDEASKIPLKDD